MPTRRVKGERSRVTIAGAPPLAPSASRSGVSEMIELEELGEFVATHAFACPRLSESAIPRSAIEAFSEASWAAVLTVLLA